MSLDGMNEPQYINSSSCRWTFLSFHYWIMPNNTGFPVSMSKSFSRCPCISKEESLGYKICTHSIEIAKWQTLIKWLYLFTFPPAVDEIFWPTLCIIDFETFASQMGVKLYVIGVLGTFL